MQYTVQYTESHTQRYYTMVVDIWKDLGKIKYVKSHNIIMEACATLLHKGRQLVPT